MEYKAWLVKGDWAKQIRCKASGSFCTEQAQRLALKGEHGSEIVKDVGMQKR